MRKKVRELQRADLKAKRRWLLIASVASMVIVVGLWILYLNLTLPTFGTPEEAKQSAPQGESVSGTFMRGLQNISDEFKTQWQKVKGEFQKNFGALEQILGKQNGFSVEQKPEEQYLPPTVEPTPQTHLP